MFYRFLISGFMIIFSYPISAAAVNAVPDGCEAQINVASFPLLRAMPKSESIKNKAASAVTDFAKGTLLGGLPGGGVFGGGSGGGQQMIPKPHVAWTPFERGGQEIELGAWQYKPRSKDKSPEIRIAQLIKDSDDKGSPHLMMLQHRSGRVLMPIGFMIFELWVDWKLTITITRETYVDGQLVDRSVERSSTEWSELLERYTEVIYAEAIWERFKLSPFGKLKGIVAQFPLPQGFSPEGWSLISHTTTIDTVNGDKVIRTVPFVVNLAAGKKNDFKLTAADNGQTQYQKANGCFNPEPSLGGMLSLMEYDLANGTDLLGESVRAGFKHETAIPDAANKPSAKKVKKPSKHAQKKAKFDAQNWARILVVVPNPRHDRIAAEFNALSQQLQLAFTFQVSMQLFKAITGYGLPLAVMQGWNHQVTHLAIRAAQRWVEGMNAGQKQKMAKAFEKLPPVLQQVFARYYLATLSMNMFLQLNQAILNPAAK